MDLKQIKQLMDSMNESNLTSFDLEFPDGVKISMKKEHQMPAPVPMQQPIALAPQMTPMQVNQVNVPNSEIAETQTNTQNTNKQEGKTIKSPMVGTFYLASSPTSKPFVTVGSKVKKGDVVCIIEAMKLMNEIESEFDGEIAEILVDNESIVEYGTPLFIVK